MTINEDIIRFNAQIYDIRGWIVSGYWLDKNSRREFFDLEVKNVVDIGDCSSCKRLVVIPDKSGFSRPGDPTSLGIPCSRKHRGEYIPITFTDLKIRKE